MSKVLSIDLGPNEQAEELIKRDRVKDTPFTIVETDGKIFGVMGNFRITEPYEDKAKLRRDLKKITWDRICQVMVIIIRQQDEIFNLIEEEK